MRARSALCFITISSVFGLLLVASASAQTGAVCGNGDVEPGEECDDGNTDPGDCCSPTCQYESATTVCRAAAGVCDVAESCDGTSDDCPPDLLLPEWTVCHASTHICDREWYCDGVRPGCYPLVYLNPPVCNPSTGPCDPVEFCEGWECPLDVLLPAGTVCRAAGGVCDTAEVCDGVTGICPADAYEPEGTSCDDGNGSTRNDQCDGSGVCAGTPSAIPALSPWGRLLVGLFVLAAGAGLLAQRRRDRRRL